MLNETGLGLQRPQPEGAPSEASTSAATSPSQQSEDLSPSQAQPVDLFDVNKARANVLVGGGDPTSRALLGFGGLGVAACTAGRAVISSSAVGLPFLGGAATLANPALAISGIIALSGGLLRAHMAKSAWRAHPKLIESALNWFELPVTVQDDAYENGDLLNVNLFNHKLARGGGDVNLITEKRIDANLSYLLQLTKHKDNLIDKIWYKPQSTHNGRCPVLNTRRFFDNLSSSTVCLATLSSVRKYHKKNPDAGPPLRDVATIEALLFSFVFMQNQVSITKALLDETPNGESCFLEDVPMRSFFWIIKALTVNFFEGLFEKEAQLEATIRLAVRWAPMHYLRDIFSFGDQTPVAVKVTDRDGLPLDEDIYSPETQNLADFADFCGKALAPQISYSVNLEQEHKLAHRGHAQHQLLNECRMLNLKPLETRNWAKELLYLSRRCDNRPLSASEINLKPVPEVKTKMVAKCFPQINDEDEDEDEDEELPL